MVLSSKEWALGVGLLVLDQVTKIIARTTEPSNSLFELTTNSGAGFGILQGQNSFLLALSGIVLILLARAVWNAHGREQTALLCFWIGVAGNAIDRILFGHVTDFINIFDWFNFPIFNVADALITISAAYLAGTMLRSIYHGWDFQKSSKK